VKIKIDENLASAHRRLLEQAGHDVADVHVEGIAGATDDTLWAHVCAEQRLLITLDTDFSDLRRFQPGTHPGALLPRTIHPSRAVVSAILARVIHDGSLESFAGCLAVADETRTRVRGRL
jgi:predicted nuclease of predicted toxin-antitoxin system